MDKHNNLSFGALLKQFRRRARITQLEFAYRVGGNSMNLAQWEGNHSHPRKRETVLAIARALLLTESETNDLLQAAHYPPEFQAQEAIANPIQYHSLFISYSNQDDTLAHRLYADLQVQGVHCWFAPEDMNIGDKIRDRIDQAIHLQDRSLLLLSEHSIVSAWVEEEVATVLEKEARQRREILFPVRVDEVVMQTSKAWAATLRRTRHIGDFTAWADPQQYQIAFERLLRDLKKADLNE